MAFKRKINAMSIAESAEDSNAGSLTLRTCRRAIPAPETEIRTKGFEYENRDQSAKIGVGRVSVFRVSTP